MNKHLKEAVRRQSIRRAHKKAVRSLIVEQEHNLYTTFVQPFVDVVDAAGLTGQDILNSLRLQLDLLFTLSPKKMDQAISNFDARKEKIAAKWEPIMERTREALGNSDLNLVTMVFAPELFLAGEALGAAYKAADSMGQYLADSGFKIPFASALLGYEPEASTTTSSAGEGESLLSKISSLFGIEAAWHAGPLLTEQDEKDQIPKKEENFQKAMREYLEVSGLKQQFEESANELVKGQKEYVEEVLAAAVPQLTLIQNLVQSTDVDEFAAAIQEAESQGLDLKAAGMESVVQDVKSAAEKLAQSEDFQKKIAEESGVQNKDASKSMPAVDQKEVEKAASKVAFVNAKKDFDAQVQEGKEKLKAAALEQLNKNMPDESDLSAMKSSPQGQEFIKVTEEAKQKIENI